MRLLFAFVVLALSTLSAAADEWLSDADMNRIFGGQMVTGMYYWRLAYTETYHPDGSISYWDSERGFVKGRWHFSKQGFCTFYDTMDGGCFGLKRASENCFENYLLEAQNGPSPRSGEEKPYVSQFWLSAKAPTCVETTS
jgi:hypothetical protein